MTCVGCCGCGSSVSYHTVLISHEVPDEEDNSCRVLPHINEATQQLYSTIMGVDILALPENSRKSFIESFVVTCMPVSY